MSRLTDELTGIVGPTHVVTSPAFTTDWTGRFVGSSPAVVQPGSTDEVAAVVNACRRHGAAIVPQGGNTGLVGGGVPLAGEVVVSLRRLDEVVVDGSAGQVQAGAGATLRQVHQAAFTHGWAYGVDFASRDRATVGGTIATNAGGLHVFRHGNTRAQVIGVEAVLGDGSVVSQLGGLTRDNAGYHLPSLLCGSEGTLGIVTTARLRLIPRSDERAAALLGFADVAAAVAAAYSLRRLLHTAEAIELFLDDGLDLVCRAMRLPPPLPTRHRAYVLVETADSVSPAPALEAAVRSLDAVRESRLAVDQAERHALWQYREKHTESVSTLGVPHKLDVALSADRLAEFIEQVPTLVEGQTWLWGHVAEGNIHVNVTGVDPGDERVDDAILRAVIERGGSISAEHGIGTAKKAWLPLVRARAEIDAYRAIKRALDPDGILNPNALLPS